MACSGNLSAMQAQNPNIVRQINEWQPLRAARGEDPLNWEAFRAHERAMNNPDPGSEAHQVFCDYKKAGGIVPLPIGDDLFAQAIAWVKAHPLETGGILLLLFLMKGRR